MTYLPIILILVLIATIIVLLRLGYKKQVADILFYLVCRAEAQLGGGSGAQSDDNDGSGGGGGAGRSGAQGANGGSGVVIVRYPGSVAKATGGTITYITGYVVHTFTSSGTFIYGS